MPVRCLKPGYRHLPLRSSSNQQLEQSTIFIRSRFEQEEYIYLNKQDTYVATEYPIQIQNNNNNVTINNIDETELAYKNYENQVINFFICKTFKKNLAFTYKIFINFKA